MSFKFLVFVRVFWCLTGNQPFNLIIYVWQNDCKLRKKNVSVAVTVDDIVFMDGAIATLLAVYRCLYFVELGRLQIGGDIPSVNSLYFDTHYDKIEKNTFQPSQFAHFFDLEKYIDE